MNENYTARIDDEGYDGEVMATIYVGGSRLGEVTLYPAADGRQVYEAWGDCITVWADHDVAELVLAEEDALGAIEAAVTEAMTVA